MIASHCPHCGPSFPHPPAWLQGQRPYTPTPEGFERFLRESVGLPADQEARAQAAEPVI
jgi:hypothetical protein